jgi:hypothetical protein
VHIFVYDLMELNLMHVGLFLANLSMYNHNAAEHNILQLLNTFQCNLAHSGILDKILLYVQTPQ